MTKIFYLGLLFLSPSVYAQNLVSGSFAWVDPLKAAGVGSFHVCGDEKIQPTKSSLRKNFLVGKEKVGFLLSGLISHSDYFEVLQTQNLEKAKASLRNKIRNAHLWRVSASGEIQDLGAPTNIDLPFTATVKDCVEGARTTLGNDCSTRADFERFTCCREKFSGPRIFWVKVHDEYRLGYSPDPSVRLKVAGEKKHRYCNVQREMKL